MISLELAFGYIVCSQSLGKGEKGTPKVGKVRCIERKKTHRNFKVRMQQHLEIKGFFAFIPYLQHSLQTIFAQRDRVYQTELERPCFLRFLAQGVRGQAKIDFDTVVVPSSACVFAHQDRGLGGGFAHIFPTCVSGEAMLRESARRVVWGWRAEALCVK